MPRAKVRMPGGPSIRITTIPRFRHLLPLGSDKFRGEFAVAAVAAGITQFTNRPNHPQGNGRIERSFLTDDLEFRGVEEFVPTAERLKRQLAVWHHAMRESGRTSRLAN